MSALEVVMTESEATQTTARIKLLLSTITETTEKVVGLIEKAEAGRAWEVLGYPSWTAYVAAEFAESLAGLQRAERIPVVQKLSGTGMSTRSIAAVTGVSVGTVHSDVNASGVQSLNTSIAEVGDATIGTDGKSYPRPRSASFLASGKPDAATVEEFGRSVPQSAPRPRRKPLDRAYRDAVYDLQRAVERLQRLTGDDRFAANAGELFARNGVVIEQAIRTLHDEVSMPLVRGGDRHE